MAEAIRGGLEAVSKGQIESALSIGLTPFQAFAMSFSHRPLQLRHLQLVQIVCS